MTMLRKAEAMPDSVAVISMGLHRVRVCTEGAESTLHDSIDSEFLKVCVSD